MECNKEWEELREREREKQNIIISTPVIPPNVANNNQTEKKKLFLILVYSLIRSFVRS